LWVDGTFGVSKRAFGSGRYKFFLCLLLGAGRALQAAALSARVEIAEPPVL
jgi:hypothetical protein